MEARTVRLAALCFLTGFCGLGDCGYLCIGNFYGSTCDIPCDNACLSICDLTTGVCDGCPSGFYGDFCDQPCPSTNCLDNQCDQQTGQCLQCLDGFAPPDCLAKTPTTTDGDLLVVPTTTTVESASEVSSTNTSPAGFTPDYTESPSSTVVEDTTFTTTSAPDVENSTMTTATMTTDTSVTPQTSDLPDTFESTTLQEENSASPTSADMANVSVESSFSTAAGITTPASEIGSTVSQTSENQVSVTKPILPVTGNDADSNSTQASTPEGRSSDPGDAGSTGLRGGIAKEDFLGAVIGSVFAASLLIVTVVTVTACLRRNAVARERFADDENGSKDSDTRWMPVVIPRVSLQKADPQTLWVNETPGDLSSWQTDELKW